jgi:DNA adenine methylase
LLQALKKHKGKVILSGYDSEMYNSELEGWHKETMKAATEMGGSAIEVIWMNYEPPVKQISMFDI